MVSSIVFFPLPVHSWKKSNSRRAADCSLRSPYAAVRHKPSEQTETGQQETSRYHSLRAGECPLPDLQHSHYCPQLWCWQMLRSSSMKGGTWSSLNPQLWTVPKRILPTSVKYLLESSTREISLSSGRSLNLD